MKKIYFIIIMGLLSFISGGCAFNSMFYYPDKENTDIEDLKCEEGFLDTENKNKIHYVFVKPDSAAIATMLILHGNAGNLAGWLHVAEPFAKAGFQVCVIDYQGFGKSEGKPTHKNLLSDSETTLNYLLNRDDVKGTKILIMGFSIGGQLGIALTAQNQEKIDALAVEGTFTSHNDIAVSLTNIFVRPFAKLLVTSPYKAKNLIKEISIPKLIIHSKADQVIPYRMGQELFNNAIEPKYFFEVTGEHLEGLDKHEEEYIEKLKLLLTQTR